LPQLVSFFLQELCRQEGRRVVAADPSLITLLAHHDWPGNLRELKNLLERMLLLATETESLSARDLPADFSVTETLEALKPMTLPSGLTGSLRELRARFEKSLIEDRLRTAGGQVSKAAESLGVERTHLHRKMRQYGLTSS
jgi:two-component system nitrogen regulation response regulator NtrX